MQQKRKKGRLIMVARGRVHSRGNLGEGQQHKILPEKQKTLLNFP